MKKKLLLLALLPSLSFASIDDTNIHLTTFPGKTNQPVSLWGDYSFTVTNKTDYAVEYKYHFALCPEAHRCEIHESHLIVKAHERRTKNLRLTKNVSYKSPGNYTVTGSIDVWSNSSDNKQYETSAQINISE